MNKQVLIVEKEEELVRIDKFLLTKLELTRTHIQKLINEGNVLVNDQVSKANYKVKSNDNITVIIPELKEMDLTPKDMSLNIVYEDSDIIVINKPKGIVVHPAPGHYEDTLVNGLLYHCKDLSGINGVSRPGIVHRIDKDTTGLLVVCKNDIAHNSIANQLQSKTCERKYIALVHGVLPHDYGTIDAPIGRDEKDRQKMCVTAKNSKDAVTQFKVLKRYDKYTLVELSLKTGRTHQIRVHMQYIKFPVVGDYKYSIKKTLETNGQMLHAYQLTLIHPTTNKEMVFKAELPEYFEEILKEIVENSNGTESN